MRKGKEKKGKKTEMVIEKLKEIGEERKKTFYTIFCYQNPSPPPPPHLNKIIHRNRNERKLKWDKEVNEKKLERKLEGK